MNFQQKSTVTGRGGLHLSRTTTLRRQFLDDGQVQGAASCIGVNDCYQACNLMRH